MIAAQTPRGKKVLIPRGWMNAVGELRTFSRVGVRDTVGDKDLWDAGDGSLSLVVVPSAVTGFAASPASVNVTTDFVTAILTGAIGSVSWAWTRITGSSAWAIAAPDQPMTAFTITLAPNTLASADFRITATDGLGRTETADVSVYAENFGTELV
jgi:hypothetical protein